MNTPSEEAILRKLIADGDGSNTLIGKNIERIEKIKEELVDAKLIRKNRQEYDVLAKMIKEKPSRMESLEGLRKLQEELDEDHEKQQTLEQKLAERRKNMSSLAVLLNTLDDTDCVDNEEKESMES